MRKAEATRTAEAEAARRLGCNDNEPARALSWLVCVPVNSMRYPSTLLWIDLLINKVVLVKKNYSLVGSFTYYLLARWHTILRYY